MFLGPISDSKYSLSGVYLTTESSPRWPKTDDVMLLGHVSSEAIEDHGLLLQLVPTGEHIEMHSTEKNGPFHQ